jgi:hypothetical protein
MRPSLRIWRLCGVLTLALSGHAYAQNDRAIVLENAPIVLLPEANRAPLATAAKGSSLILVKDEGAWLQVQFQDPRYGLRTGYVEKRFVTVQRATVQRAAEQPLDLSVPAPQPADNRPPSVTPPPPPTPAPSAATSPVRPSEPRPIGTASQTITFRKVDYSVIVGDEERSRSARLVLDPVGRTLVFADEGGGEAKELYAKVPYEAITKIVYEQAAHRRYTAGVLVSPFLFFTKAKKHWLTIEVQNVAEFPQGFLYARLDKDNYRQVLSALRAGTGLTIEEHIEE